MSEPCPGCGYVIRCKCVPMRYADKPINLTDEWLMFEAQKLTGSDCVCEDLKLLTPNDPICYLHKTLSVLQQVRDAAKKEERERIAVKVETFRPKRWWEDLQYDVLDELAADIRQMDGGK